MSFLADFIGGAADAGAGIIGNQIKLDQEESKQASLAKLNNELAIERDKVAEQTRAAIQEQARQDRQKRLAEQLAKVEEGAGEITRKREMSAANRVAPSVDDKTMGILKSQLTPEQLKKFYNIEPQTAVSELDDQIAAGNKLGAYDAVDALRSTRKDVLASEKDRRGEEKLRIDQQNANTRQDQMLLQEKRLMTAMAAIGKGGGDGADSAKIKTAKVVLEQVNAERKAKGEPLLSFEEAFSFANYAPKVSGEDKMELKRADATREFMKQGFEGQELKAKVDEFMNVAAPKKSDAPKNTPTTPPTSALKEGKVTSFANGEKWTIKNGKAVKVN